MGAFRLALAIMVALSHMDFYFHERNIGIIAVVSFLILSGLVMSALIEKHYMSYRSIPSFYLDRAMRLYPQFIVYFAACSILSYFLLPGSKAADAVNAGNIGLSLMMVPLGYYMYGVTAPEIIPPAWSLGLEASFYLAIPFILLLSLRRWCFIMSIAIFIAACTGAINTDNYGYRLLPGVLFIFLIGSFLRSGSVRDKAFIISAWGLALVLFACITTGIIERANYNLDVTAGIILGIPVIYALQKLKYSKFDEFLGNVSYGVFLNHFVFMHIAHFIGIRTFNLTQAIILIACSIGLSVLTYYTIERPFLKVRHKMRKNKKQSSSNKSAQHEYGAPPAK